LGVTLLYIDFITDSFKFIPEIAFENRRRGNPSISFTISFPIISPGRNSVGTVRRFPVQDSFLRELLLKKELGLFA
jgi:hypothetical protein